MFVELLLRLLFWCHDLLVRGVYRGLRARRLHLLIRVRRAPGGVGGRLWHALLYPRD
jgi:hypothetical protein